MTDSKCDCGKSGWTSSTSKSSVTSSINDEMMNENNAECDSKKPRIISFAEVENASKIMTSGVNRSMCIKSKVGPLVGMDELWVNLAYEQLSGSVKERAARCVLYNLTDEQKKKGVVTASRGSFAKALCHQGYFENCPITVFMPNETAWSIIEFCKKLSGNVVIEGKTLQESQQKAMRYGKENGLIFIDAYDNPDVIAGLGTVAMEILDEVYEPDIIIVPVSGGGLIAGISIATKKISPRTKIYAVESDKFPIWSSAISAGKPTDHNDKLSFLSVGRNSFESAKNLVDQCMIVEDKWIAAAMLLFMENDKIVLSGESCTGLAAILSKKCKNFCGKRIVCILPTANIEVPEFLASIDRGLIMLGRLVRLTITVPDKKNCMSKLVKHVNDLDMKIRCITQDRAFLIDDLDSVSIKCICETNGFDHVKLLRKELLKIYGDKFNLEARETETSCSSGRCRGK